MNSVGSDASETASDSTRRMVGFVRARSWFMGAALLMFGFFLLSMLNAVVGGGCFGELDDEKWDELIRWPWIPLPAWLVIAVAVVAPISAIVMAKWARRLDIPDLLTLGITYTVAFFCMLPLIFSTMYLMPGGTVINSDHPDLGQGLHWIAAPIQIITVGVLVGRSLALRFGKTPEQDATEAAAPAASGSDDDPA